jgi:hypothetical protein
MAPSPASRNPRRTHLCSQPEPKKTTCAPRQSHLDERTHFAQTLLPAPPAGGCPNTVVQKLPRASAALVVLESKISLRSPWIDSHVRV